MSFRTKVDLSSNRQVKQFVETFTNLSGGTSFGLTFNDLPSGPDLSNTGITNTYVNLISTYSGNSGTTNYFWYDPRMALGISGLSPLTPSNSGITQNTRVYQGYNPITIDGNISYSQYSGVSFDVSNISMVPLGGGNYSGSVTTFMLDIINAEPLDYLGRTIWVDVSGITRTERVIVTDSPVIGYVLTCADGEGMGIWTPVSGTTYANYLWVSGSSGTGSIRVNNGTGNDATADYAVAEGIGSLAIGMGSHAEGSGTIASGSYSHAEGNLTIASGVFSHAEGFSTSATTTEAHAEGQLTIASGDSSHAEGYYSIAGGIYSHAQNAHTFALGPSSHAGGEQSIASGLTSFVHGYNSLAGGSGTIVLGNNISGTTANTTYIEALNIKTLGVYADNTAATGAGLTIGTLYRTSTGQLMIRY